jgi:hypothetical protein
MTAERFVEDGLAIRPAPADVRCLQIDVNHVFHVGTCETDEPCGVRSEPVAVVDETTARSL